MIAGGAGDARSDAEYDRRRAADVATLVVPEALRTLGVGAECLTGEERCVNFCAPPTDARGAHGARTGADGVVRFNPVRCAVVAFGHDALHAYVGVLDLTTGVVRGERAAQVRYADVTVTTTRLAACRLAWRGRVHEIDDAETLVLATADESVLTLPMRSPTWARVLGGGELTSRPTDRALSVVRSMVRQRRPLSRRPAS